LCPFRTTSLQRYSFYDRQDVAAALEPAYLFQPQRGSWGISGIVRFGVGPNYVFLVSFGQTQAGHDFDEEVYSNGIVQWQSQPGQGLTTPMIRQLIRHDCLENDILLFLRTKTDGPYMFLGFLKYLDHDRDRENPVHFHWQILEFDAEKDYESMPGLKLKPVPGSSAGGDVTEQEHPEQRLVPTPAPLPASSGSGVAISTADFRRPPIDYEERDRKNRKLGKIGEELVFASKRSEQIKAGRKDLADRVEMVCRTLGESAGYDIRSFDKHSGEEIHLEVKTTSGPLTTPFFMSSAEVEYAKSCAHRYKICRVYAYSAEAKDIWFFEIDKPTEALDFTPVSFRVRCK